MKPIDSFRLFLEQNSRLSTLQIDEILRTTKPRRLKRREPFQQHGKSVTQLGFLVSGVFRAFYIDHLGNERVKFFRLENHFVTDIAGFKNRGSAKLTFEAITPCLMLTISIEDVERLCSSIDGLKLQIVEWCLSAFIDIQNQRDRIDAGLMTDRYVLFQKEHPGLELRIAQKYIAQYLNTTVPTMSKIKKKRAHLLS